MTEKSRTMTGSADMESQGIVLEKTTKTDPVPHPGAKKAIDSLSQGPGPAHWKKLGAGSVRGLRRRGPGFVRTARARVHRDQAAAQVVRQGRVPLRILVVVGR